MEEFDEEHSSVLYQVSGKNIFTANVGEELSEMIQVPGYVDLAAETK